MVFNSFKYSRISNSLDGRGDDLFRWYEDIDKRYEIIQFQNDDELYLDDDNVEEVIQMIIIFIKI